MKTFLVFLLLPLAAVAGNNRFTGNARMDLLSVSMPDSLPQSKSIMVQSEVDRSKLKNSLLGGAMSLVVPGAGEFYSNRYLKSGIFFAAEVIGITAAIVYNNRGNDQTTAFQNYANQHWSAVDYAVWLNQNGANYEVAGTTYPTIAINPNTSLPPWQRVDFNQINQWEALPHSEGFSHQLPTYNTQQYYELIGKYSQFKYGWDTYQYNGSHTADDGYNVAYIPQQMLSYADSRGKANSAYYTAELATALVVVNHVISALDAAWSTSNYNKEVTSNMGMRFQDIGGGEVALVTELTLQVSL
ncbi:MAG: hypothetical protein WBZ48_01480 [Bacteroidota bacterium]